MKSYHLWGFALLFIVLNSLKLENSSLYLDEAYSLFYAQQDFTGLSAIFAREANPPLYFVTLFGWVHLFGANVFSGRMLSLLFSAILLLVLGGWISKRFGVMSSVVFCLLYISSPTVINMSMEIRTFSLTALLIALAVLWFINFWENKNALTFFAFTGLSLLALYSHLNAIFPIALLGIIQLFTEVKGIYKFGYVLILGTGVLPLLLILTETKLSSTTQWLAIPNWSTVQTEFFLLASNWQYVLLIIVTCCTVPFVVQWKEVQHKFTWKVFFTVAIGSWLASFLVSQFIPVFLAKYLYFTIVFFLTIIAILIPFLTRNLSQLNKAIIIFVIALTYSSGMFSTPLKPEDWKGAVNYISKIKTDDHMVIVSPGYMYRPFSYYYDYPIFSSGKDPVRELYPKGIVFLKQIAEELFEHINPKKVIYISSHQQISDPNWNNVQLLNERYMYLSDTSFNGIQVFRFEERN